MRTVNIGAQGFAKLRESGCFYVDKTNFIKEWWEAADDVTLITRPRRFGKTLNMSMLECFFSLGYAGRTDLFEGLSVWNYEKYRKLQGTWPVIFITFAHAKADNFKDVRKQICSEIFRQYQMRTFLLEGDTLSDAEKEIFNAVRQDMDNVDASESICNLCMWLSRYYGKNVIVLLDEYDTPMQEAYVSGYWNELTSFFRSLFNSTFKTNPYLERGIMTGITRVSRESVFSDLNNLKVITTTSTRYAESFGFTEQEVFDALDEMEMSDMRSDVKKWYDGFTFGDKHDIYNPWSVINLLDERRFGTYWANTSSNSLIDRLIRQGGPEIKQIMEDLLAGKSFMCRIDEQIVFDQLEDDANAVWSVLLASGYLKVVNRPEMKFADTGGTDYELSLTNLEVKLMFENLIEKWFRGGNSRYNDFLKALMLCDIRAMNRFMNETALATFSYFDTGNGASEYAEPERFYHGFVLGLMVDLRDRYVLTSNRESGFGRYDIMLEPLRSGDNAYIIEFKAIDIDEEKDLNEAAEAALRQIKEKNYDALLKSKGIQSDKIKHYAFAFEGKKVLVMQDA